MRPVNVTTQCPGPAPGEEAIAQRALEGDAARRVAIRARHVRQDPREQLDRERTAPDGKQRAQLLALRLSLPFAALAAGDVDLEPAPAEPAPEEAARPAAPPAPGPGRIVSAFSATRPDRRRSPSGAAASVSLYSWLKRRQTSVATAIRSARAAARRTAAAADGATMAATTSPTRSDLDERSRRR